jgi:putative DNA primase/helicase
MSCAHLPELTSAEADLLAELEQYSDLEYESNRKQIAQQRNVRVTYLDRLREELDRKKKERRDARQERRDEETWPTAVDGSRLIEAVVSAIGRFVVMSSTSATTVALWVLHAHTHNAFDVSPILLVSSPTKGCGKSTLLDLLARLVPRPMLSASCTAAVLYRSTHLRPTLLVDEADLFLGDDRNLVAFFNAGHRRGVPFRRCEVDDNHVAEFESWCAKAIAQIGLPTWPTLLDRCLVVKLDRKTKKEAVERFRKGREYPELENVRRMAARWALDHLEELRKSEPRLPESFDNRLADNWEPLLAIADAIGADAGREARRSAEALSRADEEGREILLLRDLLGLFVGREELPTEAVVSGLIALEERPWDTANRGRPITGHWLGRTLGRFGIDSVKVTNALGKERRGYRRTQFLGVWERYLGALNPSGEASKVSEASGELSSRDAFDASDASDASDTSGAAMMDELF